MSTFFRRSSVAVAVALLTGAACTVHKSGTPPLTGPSEFGLSIAVSAIPDSLNQDGASQSAIVVTAYDANGQAKAGVAIRVDIAVGGVVQDYGKLSAHALVTGSDGTARAVYTAPAASVSASFTTVSILAVPTGSDSQTAAVRFADIRLTPPGIILPPAETPTPAFTETPTPVNFNIPATFDASTSCGGKVTNGVCSNSSAITKYAWDFGDGSVGTGKTAAHTYKGSTQPSTTFNVTLTVTNDRSLTASTTQAIAVAASPAPTVAFVVSPTAPVVGQTVFFDANGSRPSAGHTIVEWDWDFGDGVIASGSSLPLTTHTYSIPATYAIVLKVVDEVGQVGTASVQLPVGSGSPTAVLSLTDLSGNTVQADATASTAAGGATITNYLFVWDNGGDANDSGPAGTIAHKFLSLGIGPHTVRLTVTDSVGRTATTQLAITTK